MWIAFQSLLNKKRKTREPGFSYPCVPSQAKPARRLGSRSFAVQDIKHAAKRVSINIGINTNTLAIAKINLDHADFSASGSD